MKVYYSDDFSGFYPVGTSAVVRANNLEEATILISAALNLKGLEFDGTLTEFKGKGVVILQDGDY
jgi:hypothetical protein